MTPEPIAVARVTMGLLMTGALSLPRVNGIRLTRAPGICNPALPVLTRPIAAALPGAFARGGGLPRE
jgi:hypothetical protein